jgi:hypothetical protein
MAWMFVRSTDTIIIYDEKVTAREPDCTPQEHDQELAWRVQDIIAGLGLIQTDFSIAGGRIVHIPHVVSVAAGPPVGLHIRTLPGQTPDNFAAHAPAIAYNLGVAEVRVVPLGPSLIRLDLLPGTSREVGEAAIYAAGTHRVSRPHLGRSQYTEFSSGVDHGPRDLRDVH